MTYKSLLTDEIEVEIITVKQEEDHEDEIFWILHNPRSFGFISMCQVDFSETIDEVKANFIACAKRYGWKKWKFVE